MGSRYILYRFWHEIERKVGALKWRHPSNITLNSTIDLDYWKKSKNPFLIEAKENLRIPKCASEELQNRAEKILRGQFQYFNSEWIDIGKSYNWISNPSNGYEYDINKHWSEIADISEEAGDIKYVWEKSRFSYILHILRYDYHFNKDLSEFVFSEIESWIDANPINQGPNWRCSQEISLRIFNWCYVLYYYQNSSSLTEERWKKLQQFIYASLHHVYHHINFSRIAVRNNHAITETLLLTLSNILFPFIPETKRWSQEGLKWFEEEINYQIYDDGTFLQFSMNYHRVVVQLLSFGIGVYQNNTQKFSKIVYEKAYKSLNFLYQCMQDENGWLPNYGSNDGALFFPFTDLDYRNYYPQLNSLHFILTGTNLSQDRTVNEDKFWFGGISIDNKFPLIQKKYGTQSFPIGGFYLCRVNDFLTFIRCGSHKDRPAQADNLHVDIWYKNKNILRDSGSYKYNTSKEFLDYFMGTKSHNTVLVEDYSQMYKGGRFIWYYWTQAISSGWEEDENAFIFKGRVKAFQFLSKKAVHERKISILKNENSWIIEDKLSNLDNHSKCQVWHPNDSRININSEANKKSFKSYNSNYYGQYTEERSFYYDFENEIKTTITFNI